MGVSLHVSCVCGYEARASIGSTRVSHGQVFVYPHRCESCSALVNVDLLKQPVCCPNCGSKTIEQYGLRTPTRTKAPKPNWLRRLFQPPPIQEASESPEAPTNQVDASYCYVLKSDFSLFADANQCPKCGQPSLIFQPPDVMFD